jgi:hypothetical protein
MLSRLIRLIVETNALTGEHVTEVVSMTAR